jgi:hypothetical protein
VYTLFCFVRIVTGTFCLKSPSTLIPIALLCDVDMSVVLDICHAVESVVKVGAQSFVLQLRYKAHSICFLPYCFFSVYGLVYDLHMPFFIRDLHMLEFHMGHV